MKQLFEAWQVTETQLLFASADSIAEQRAKGLIGSDAKLLYFIEADTWEEACAIHYLRAGFGPYKPVGAPEVCPNCGSWFYPEGSGQCWKCGPVL